MLSKCFLIKTTVGWWLVGGLYYPTIIQTGNPQYIGYWVVMGSIFGLSIILLYYQYSNLLNIIKQSIIVIIIPLLYYTIYENLLYWIILTNYLYYFILPNTFRDSNDKPSVVLAQRASPVGPTAVRGFVSSWPRTRSCQAFELKNCQPWFVTLW